MKQKYYIASGSAPPPNQTFWVHTWLPEPVRTHWRKIQYLTLLGMVQTLALVCSLHWTDWASPAPSCIWNIFYQTFL